MSNSVPFKNLKADETIILPTQNSPSPLPHPEVSVTQQYWYKRDKGYVAATPIRRPYTWPLKHRRVFIGLLAYAGVSIFFCLPLGIFSSVVAKRALANYNSGIFQQAIGQGIISCVMSTVSIVISLTAAVVFGVLFSLITRVQTLS